MKHVKFRPWVGENYQEGIFGKKILILGESHYCKEDKNRNPACIALGHCSYDCMNEACFSQTQDELELISTNYTGERYQQSFMTTAKSAMGRDLTNAEVSSFWKNVAFYNYMQHSQSGPTRPIEFNHDYSEAFREVLESLMPDYIIVWGVRLWKTFLPGWNGVSSEITLENGDKAPVWTYNIKEKEIHAICVHHPCIGKGREWRYWHQFYKEFLGLSE